MITRFTTWAEFQKATADLDECNFRPWVDRKAAFHVMKRAMMRHHRSCEDDCNGVLTQKGATSQANAERRLEAMASHWNMVARFQGDPRGCTVKLCGRNERVES